MRTKITMLVLFLLSILMLSSCTAEPSTEPVTRRVVHTADTDAPVMDVVLTVKRLYILTTKDIRVMEEDAVVLTVPLASEDYRPAAIAVTDSSFYVAGVSDFDGIQLQEYDLSGNPVRTYDGMEAFASYSTVFDLLVLDGTAYIAAVGRNEQLFAYDLAKDTVTETGIKATAVVPYGKSELLVSYSGTMQLYDAKKQETKALPDGVANKNVYWPTYDAKREILFYVRPYNLANVDTSARYLYRAYTDSKRAKDAPALLIPDPSPDRFDAWNGSMSLYDNVLAVTENGDVVLYDNVDGVWPEVEEPLRVLSLGSNSLGSLHFAYWQNAAIKLAYQEHQKTLLPCKVENGEIVRNTEDPDATDICLEDFLAGKTYDLLYYNGGMVLTAEDAKRFVDLSQYDEIADSFADMLPGIQNLCSIDEAIVGVPMGFPFAIIVAGEFGTPVGIPDYLDSVWTYADYLAHVQAAPENTVTPIISKWCILDVEALYSNALAGNMPTKEDLAQAISAYQELDDLHMFADTESKNATLLGVYGMDRDTVRLGALLAPLYSDAARIPVKAEQLMLNVESERRDDAILLLTQMLRKDMMQKAYNDDYSIVSGPLPVFYYQQSQWDKYSELETYAEILRNSVPFIDPPEGVRRPIAHHMYPSPEEADPIVNAEKLLEVLGQILGGFSEME